MRCMVSVVTGVSTADTAPILSSETICIHASFRDRPGDRSHIYNEKAYSDTTIYSPQVPMTEVTQSGNEKGQEK